MDRVEIINLLEEDKLNAVMSVLEYDETIGQESDLLSDVRLVIKDNISLQGSVTTASSKMLENYIAPFNATVVEKLKNHGGDILAKTSMDEFGMGGFGRTSFMGPTLNPHDLTRVSGGSSSGSAALVGSGLVDGAIGTDTGDSVRHPASFCGVVGFKPTYGTISRYGVIPFAPSLDHVGILGKDVKTTAKILEAIAGYDPKDSTSIQKPYPAFSQELDNKKAKKKIGIIMNVVEAITNPKILSEFEKLVENLKSEGYEVVEIELNQDLLRLQNVIYQIISNAEAVSTLSNLDGVNFGTRQHGDSLEEIMINSRTAGFNYQVRERMLKGGYSLLAENKEDVYFKAQKIRSLIVAELNEKLTEVDYLMAPATSRIAPKLDDDHYDYESDEFLIAQNYMVMDNFSGHPGISFPLGKDEGMPFNVYISSKAFNDLGVLQVAQEIENIVGDL